MDATLIALAGILLKAAPTFILVVLLHFYIKRMFFKPLEKVLDNRYQATEGARKQAEATFAMASQKAADYEAALRVTRTEIYHAFEEQRLKLRQEQDAAVEKAKRTAQEIVKKGKDELEAEAAEAGKALESASELLATRIAESMFQRRVN